MNDKMTSDNFTRQKSHFLNLFSLALSDNNVEPSELEILYEIGIEYGFDKREIDFLIENPHKVKIDLPESNDEIIRQLIDLTRIILADGKIDIREISSLKAYCKNVGLDEKKLEEIIMILVDGLKAKENVNILSNRAIKIIGD